MDARILVVEDNPDNSLLVTWILEDEGYQVTCVESGEACLATLSNEVFDLILMDISLPGISGKETTQRIRQMPDKKNIPIFALTAHAIQEEQKSIWDCGVDDLLTKPIEEALLLQSIEKHLRKTLTGS